MTTCGNIRFTDAKLEELDGTQIMASVQKAEILSIELKFGESVEKPVRQILIGVLLCILAFVIGVWPLLGYFSDFKPGAKTPYFQPIASAITLFIFGGFLILPVFKKAHYLLVTTSSGTRKLTVKGCEAAELIKIGNNLGYVIS